MWIPVSKAAFARQQTPAGPMRLPSQCPVGSGMADMATEGATPAVPIIICSGTKRRDDAVLALKLGADDFIDKPFSVDELQARMEAVLRRTGSPQVPPPVAGRADVQHIEGLVIDHARCSVALDGLALQLTPTEYRL